MPLHEAESWPTTEIDRWRAYDRISPLDHTRRLELAIGTLAAVAAREGDPSDYVTDWTIGLTLDADEPPAPAPNLIAKLDALFPVT